MSQRKMRRNKSGGGAGPLLVIVGGVVLLGAALFALFQGRGASGGAAIEVTGEPRLKVDREVIDFGEVPLGKWVTAEFRLTNVGDQPLRFSEPPWVELVEGC